MRRTKFLLLFLFKHFIIYCFFQIVKKFKILLSHVSVSSAETIILVGFAETITKECFLIKAGILNKSDNNSINICQDMPGAYCSLIVSERVRAEYARNTGKQTRELSVTTQSTTQRAHSTKKA